MSSVNITLANKETGLIMSYFILIILTMLSHLEMIWTWVTLYQFSKLRRHLILKLYRDLAVIKTHFNGKVQAGLKYHSVKNAHNVDQKNDVEINPGYEAIISVVEMVIGREDTSKCCSCIQILTCYICRHRNHSPHTNLPWPTNTTKSLQSIYIELWHTTIQLITEKNSASDSIFLHSDSIMLSVFSA